MGRLAEAPRADDDMAETGLLGIADDRFRSWQRNFNSVRPRVDKPLAPGIYASAKPRASVYAVQTSYVARACAAALMHRQRGHACHRG